MPCASLALTFSFGEKVSKKNFAFVKSTFEEHRFDGSPYLRNHKFAVPLTLGPYVFCLCRKVSKRAPIRTPTVSLCILPLCRRIVSTTPHKRLFELLLLSTQEEASIAYGNISNVIISLVTLHVYFCIFVCTARSQTK